MSDDPEPKRSLFNKDFVLLWQGQLVSQLGNQAFSLAMMYWLMETTGSASLMGTVMMVSLLPGVVVGPFGGALADRNSRWGIILVSDLARGAMILGLAGLMFLRPGEHELIIAVLFVVALLSGVVRAGFQPAMSAAIPDLVPRDKVAAANSLMQFSVQGSVFVGQAIGGLLYRWMGAAHLFVIDGVTYLLSALSEAFLRIPQKRPAELLSLQEVVAAYKKDTLDGIRYVWRRRGMRSFLFLSSAVNFFAMPVILLLPFYANEELGQGAAWYGFLLAAVGAGSLFGYLVAGTVQIPPERRPWIVLSALLTTAAALAGLGMTQTPLIALALMFVVGSGTGIINILVMTLFQVATPSEMRGRVMSLVLALSSAAAPLGMALGGFLGDATDKNIPALYVGCGVTIAVLSLLAATRASFREFLKSE